MIKRLLKYISVVALPLLLTGCIDEDMSDCGADLKVHYTMKLRADMHTQLDADLDADQEQAIKEALAGALADVFTDVVADVRFEFYNALGMAYSEDHIVNNNNAQFTLYLPMDEYRHHAYANVDAEPGISRSSEAQPEASMLHQAVADLTDSHRKAVFLGLCDVTVEDLDKTIEVVCYPVNCATALVIDLNGHAEPEEMTCTARGFATAMHINDKSYVYERDYTVKPLRLSDGDQHRAFYAVHMPSRTIPYTRADEDVTGCWHYDLVVTNADGTKTKTTLSARTAVGAGELRVLKVKLQDNGSVTSADVNVGVSVSLDWHQGGSYNPEL